MKKLIKKIILVNIYNKNNEKKVAIIEEKNEVKEFEQRDKHLYIGIPEELELDGFYKVKYFGISL